MGLEVFRYPPPHPAASKANSNIFLGWNLLANDLDCLRVREFCMVHLKPTRKRRSAGGYFAILLKAAHVVLCAQFHCQSIGALLSVAVRTAALALRSSASCTSGGNGIRLSFTGLSHFSGCPSALCALSSRSCFSCRSRFISCTTCRNLRGSCSSAASAHSLVRRSLTSPCIYLPRGNADAFYTIEPPTASIRFSNLFKILHVRDARLVPG